jgi:pilus assembly protein Flp/PilA
MRDTLALLHPAIMRTSSRLLRRNRMLKNFIALLRDDEGATLVEYTLIIALVAAACIIVITTLGTTIKNELTTVSNSIP